MFKTARNVLLTLAVASSLNAAGTLSQNEVNTIQNLNLFKNAQIKVTKGYDVGSLYLLDIQVQGKADEIYLTKDKKYLITGDAIDTTSGGKLTIPADMTGVIGNEAFTYGTGSDEYVLFTDPECPYCKKFESYFPQISDKVKIRVFYYPLDFHKNARDISLYVMSLDSKAKKEKAMLNTNKDTKAFKNRKISKSELAKLEKHLDKQIEVANKLKVRGTPAVFDKEGNKVVWPEMLAKYGITVQ